MEKFLFSTQLLRAFSQNWKWRVILFLALMWGIHQANAAGSVVIGEFKNFKDFYSAPSSDNSNQVVKTIVSGERAQPLTNKQVKIFGLRIDSVRDDGRVELKVLAEECVLNIDAREAWGAARLEVSASDGMFTMEGVGFYWNYPQGLLIVSNKVVNTLSRRILGTRSLEALTNRTATAASATNETALTISSDECYFLQSTNRVIQKGHVVVDDPRIRLTCGFLQVETTPARKMKSILASENVVFLNKTDQSMATCGDVLYESQPDGVEILHILNHPVWQDKDGRQKVKADEFTYLMSDKSLKAEGNAEMTLPRGQLVQPVLLGGTTNSAAGADATNLIHIASRRMSILLPTTNRVSRLAVAEENVVISSPSDQMTARCQKAVYDESVGTLELLGGVQWDSEGRLLKIQSMVMDRTNRVIRGQGDLFFRQPIAQGGMTVGGGNNTNRPVSTNQVLEVRAREFVCYTNRLILQGAPVTCLFYESNRLQGKMVSATLEVGFSDHLESLKAQKNVVAENYPPRGANNKVFTNMLSCNVLAVRISPSGQVMAVVAADNVQAAQIEYRTNNPVPIVSELTCGILTAVLMPKTGTVDKLVAEQNVMVQQGDKMAKGTNAIYTASSNMMELTGNPEARFADGKLTGAQVLIWDRNTGLFKGRGKYRLETTVSVIGSNQFNPFLPKKK